MKMDKIGIVSSLIWGIISLLLTILDVSPLKKPIAFGFLVVAVIALVIFFFSGKNQKENTEDQTHKGAYPPKMKILLIPLFAFVVIMLGISTKFLIDGLLPKYPVEFTFNQNGGDLEAKIINKKISSGDLVPKGKTVTFTATPKPYYRLKSHTLDGAEFLFEEDKGVYVYHLTVKGPRHRIEVEFTPYPQAHAGIPSWAHRLKKTKNGGTENGREWKPEHPETYGQNGNCGQPGSYLPEEARRSFLGTDRDNGRGSFCNDTGFFAVARYQ